MSFPKRNEPAGGQSLLTDVLGSIPRMHPHANKLPRWQRRRRKALLADTDRPLRAQLMQSFILIFDPACFEAG